MSASKRCDHVWRYDHSVYDGRTAGENCVRRWCERCGLIQHTYTTGRWYESCVGDGKTWGEYPDGYDVPEGFDNDAKAKK